MGVRQYEINRLSIGLTGREGAGSGSEVRGRTLLCWSVPFRPCGTRMLVTYYVTAQFCGYAGSATALFNRDIVLIALSSKISITGLCFPEFQPAFYFIIKTPSQDK
jgi:Fe2+ transport system protein B